MKLFFLCLSTISLLAFCPSQSFAADIDWQKNLKEGYQQLSMGNTDKAVDIFSKKVKKYPSSAACHTALGRAYKRLGKIDEAKGEFQQATELEPNYPDGFYELGVVQEFDKHWADAALAFEKYLQLKPDASERKTLADRIRSCKNQITQ